MIKFNIITIFPNIFDSYFKESLIARAQKNKLIDIKIHNLRDYTSDKHKTVDDKPFGGGLGMTMKFDQKTAYNLSKMNQLIFICGRYEGVDERVAKKIADIELSIGDYVLMGGEIPALVVIESITRLIPGAIGKKELLTERITKSKGFLEYVQYTRPEIFNNWKVPKVLLSGDHKKIEKWKKEHGKVIEK